MINEIKGKCKKHGYLNKENGYLCKDSNIPSGYRLRCKICRYETRVNNYYRNQEENIRKATEWKKENRERVNAQTRANRLIDIEATRKKEADKYQKKLVKNPDRTRALPICRKRGINLEQFYKLVDDHKG
jgi:hypothetical protein